MNRGVFHGSMVQQMMSSSNSSSNGSTNWWSMNQNMRPQHEQTFPSLPSSPSSTPMFYQYYPQPCSNNNSVLPINHSWHGNLDSHEPWTQILLGGFVGDESKYGSITTPNFQSKKMMLENWEDQVLYSSSEASHNMAELIVSSHDHNENKIHHESNNNCSWNHQILSSPRSSINTSFSSNMLDFAENNKERSGRHQPENSSECNSTSSGAAFKKARVQVSSSSQIPNFKVRKEKLGDRITALHQLISPFGKTDTASVLLEAIGYIRFLHGQISALSSPYLKTGSGNNKQSIAQGDQMTSLFPEDPGQLLNESGIKKRGPDDQQELDDEPKKDLKSRGLCLVPVSYTLHVGNENGADFWAPMAFGAGFQ